VAQDLPFETHETGGLSASLSAMVEARLEALARRWHTQSDAAQVVASYLRCHPCVADLRYPGLKSDPSFEVASRTLQGGFGPLVDYRVVGTQDWCRVCCNEEDPRDQVMTLERLLAKS
jgi:O-acetylhomoserine/O-acetylserine sulfhydrylase-like pyridoxal-dependent enzyme